MGLNRIFAIFIFGVGLTFINIRSTGFLKVFLWLTVGFILLSLAVAFICSFVAGLLKFNNFIVKNGGSKELVIALISLLTAVLTFTAGKIFEHWLDIQQQVANEIKPTYTKIINFLIALREENLSIKAVSYTHLTLPTICSV